MKKLIHLFTLIALVFVQSCTNESNSIIEQPDVVLKDVIRAELSVNRIVLRLVKYNLQNNVGKIIKMVA